MLYELVITDGNTILVITKIILFKPQPVSCSLKLLSQFVTVMFLEQPIILTASCRQVFLFRTSDMTLFHSHKICYMF